MNKSVLKKAVMSFSIVAILVLSSMILTKNSMDFYKSITKPDLAPPAILFPIVWTILYSILGITLTYFYDDKVIRNAIIINIMINVIWPVLFFRFQLLFISIIWLIFIIISTIKLFLKIEKNNKLFMYLNLPYLIWLFFALYLNVMIFLLN